MSATNNNSIFFSSLDNVSLSPLRLSNLNSQEQTKPRSFPVLLQPKLQRLPPFSLLGSKQSLPRTFLIQELDFSFVSNTALKPYSERTSIVIDQTWARAAKAPQEVTRVSQRNSVSSVYQLLNNTPPESSHKEWSNTLQEPTRSSFLKQEQSNKENESESKEFACSECDKIYKGKNARSILRRHLKDKHKIEQPRGTRWDNDPNRPKTDEERRQRMLESKRRSALKARERKNNQRAMMQQSLIKLNK